MSGEKSIIAEMRRPVPWGIPSIQGGSGKDDAEDINKAEKQAIKERRCHYNLMEREKTHAVGLALSGGGIRSATLSLGVLIALAKRGLLPQFDYLSTVSGGGYLGSFLTAFLNSPTDRITTAPIGLRSDELPFLHKGGEAEALRHIRHHSKYLASGRLSDRLRMIAAQLYGMVLNGIGVIILASAFVLLEYQVRTGQWFEKLWTLLPTRSTPRGRALANKCLGNADSFTRSALRHMGDRRARAHSRWAKAPTRRRYGARHCGWSYTRSVGLERTRFVSPLDRARSPVAEMETNTACYPRRDPSDLLRVRGRRRTNPKVREAHLRCASAIAAPLFLFGVYLWLYQAAEAPWIVPLAVGRRIRLFLSA